MNRRTRRLFAIGWLFLLHALADVTVGLYRCHDFASDLTDLLAAALPISQICLLAIWLALGTEPLSWRVAGLVASVFFILSVYTRLLFPVWEPVLRELQGLFWSSPHWWFFWRPSGPGDLLIKTPILVAGLLVPLASWRLVRASRRAFRLPWRRWLQWRLRLQFRFQDLFIWVCATCVVLGTIAATPPYPGWYGQVSGKLQSWLGTKWCRVSLLAAVMYVILSLLCLWVWRSRQGLSRRATCLAAVTLLSATLLQGYQQAIGPPSLPLALMFRPWAPWEVLTAVTVVLFMLGSTKLVLMYDAPLSTEPRPPGRGLPTALSIRGKDSADKAGVDEAGVDEAGGDEGGVDEAGGDEGGVDEAPSDSAAAGRSRQKPPRGKWKQSPSRPVRPAR